MKPLCALRRYLLNVTECFTLWLSAILAWSSWTPVLLFGSLLGLVLRHEDVVMVILTVQTSIDAQATKTLQAHFRAQDQKQGAILSETIESVAEMLGQVRAMQDSMLDIVARAEHGDRISAKSQKMILAALESQNNFYDLLAKGGISARDKTRKTARRARRTRTAHGRPNRKAS